MIKTTLTIAVLALALTGTSAMARSEARFAVGPHV